MSIGLPTNVLYYGQEEPLSERVMLRAGPLSLVYAAGDLRYIKLSEREILRRIYVALRDRNWGTVPALLSNVHIESSDDSFRIAYDAEHKQGKIDFAWQATITGDTRGTITFAMDGVARSTFLRNRIGFCVLHPMRECVGASCCVEYTDGTVEEGAFPEFISPHQPFMDIRAISHLVQPGLWAEVRFAGDVFEMEDQRNWTDASFKCYSTPLALPFPVEVREGTRIAQSVTLSLRGSVPSVPREMSSSPVTLTVGAQALGPLPRIGLGVASHGQPLDERELAALRRLNLAHLRVDLHLAQPAYRAALLQAASEARPLGVSLESDPLRIDGLALRAGDRVRVILANLTDDPQDVVVQNMPADLRVRVLDERTAKQAMRTPLQFRVQEGERTQVDGETLHVSLRPYAVWTLNG